MRSGVLMVLFYFVVTGAVNAQCCGAGNPVSGFGDVFDIPYKVLVFSPSYKYSFSGQYYEGSSKSTVHPDKMNYNFVSVDLAYGLTPRISLYGQIGYFINKSKIYSITNWEPLRGYGIGDSEFNISYDLIKKPRKKYSLCSSLGIKFPIGVFDQEVKNVKLPISLQPSSGSLKYNASVLLHKGYDKYNFSLKILAEYANKIESKNFEYKYGNLYIISFNGSYEINDNMNVLAQIRYEYRAKSKRENDQIVDSSGGQVVYFIPNLSYAIQKDLGISIYPGIPLYKYMNGTQIANTFSISIKINKSFDLY